MAKGPVLIELEEEGVRPNVVDAPPVPDAVSAAPEAGAMQVAARLAARRPSWLFRLLWWLIASLLAAVLSVSAWRFVNDLIVQMPLIGIGVGVLMLAVLLVLAVVALREVAAFARLSRLDGVRHAAAAASGAADLTAARVVCERLVTLYRSREETRWGQKRFAELRQDQLDADGLLSLAEAELMRPLDAAAVQEITTAARQVATVTALVPLALVDVVAALAANVRMIRRIAEVYGGRSGFLGSWRLMRAVLSHLVATGAITIGDDLLEPFVGGTVLGKVSRRFGEGLLNGALTVRVGLAAMEVCRPLPFMRLERPKLRAVLQGALAGIWSGSKET